MFLKILVIVGLIRLLIYTEKPFLCSGLYTVLYFLIELMGSAGLISVFIGSAIVLACSSLYFWLLYKFDEGLPYWGILIGGLLIALV